MDIFSYYKRFLKEHGLYQAFIKYNKNVSKVTDKTFNYRSLLSNFLINTVGYYPIFCGYSTSPCRRKLYALNKKWKERVKNSFLQHNIEVGDTVAVSSFYGDKRYYTVESIDGLTVIIKINNYRGTVCLFGIDEVKGKKLIKNVYFKEKNIEYGKINNAKCNEIQLQ